MFYLTNQIYMSMHVCIKISPDWSEFNLAASYSQL